jgi:hypothetical protein
MSAEYTYRRKLRASELIPAFGAAAGLGLAAFYVVRLLLQRTPLLPRTATPDALPEPRPSRPRSTPIETR